MITQLYQENYKCFSEVQLPLAPLTLFTGLNAAGKSSSLQTLLLLAQTSRGGQNASSLKLNGSIAMLGNPTDVINMDVGGTRLALGFSSEETSLLWRFVVSSETESKSLNISELEVKHPGRNLHIEREALEGLWPNIPEIVSPRESLDSLVFLSAARQVGSEVFPVPDDELHSKEDVGKLGEFAPSCLHKESETLVPEAKWHPNTKRNGTLRHQVDCWMTDLFGEVLVNAVPISRTNLTRLEFRTGLTTDWSRPANVGFGISYAFPIVVAALVTSAGRTLIIDSPEAHLHPRAQARMGSFLAQIAASGTQVLIETHSDHVMDGIRIAVKELCLPSEATMFHYFSKKDGLPNITTPTVDRAGRLSEWPEGFFDQHRRSTARLLKP